MHSAPHLGQTASENEIEFSHTQARNQVWSSWTHHSDIQMAMDGNTKASLPFGLAVLVIAVLVIAVLVITVLVITVLVTKSGTNCFILAPKATASVSIHEKNCASLQLYSCRQYAHPSYPLAIRRGQAYGKRMYGYLLCLRFITRCNVLAKWSWRLQGRLIYVHAGPACTVPTITWS